MIVSTDFVGGNARLLSVDEEKGIVHFAPDLRDTSGEWFYWAFCVKGAQGRTLTFDISPRQYIGYFGAAVSHDLFHWEWSGTVNGDLSAFTYTFGDDESCVYFAHDMLYHPAQFDDFCEKHALAQAVVCLDRGGTPIPCVTVGNGSRTVLLTARHHCCEATGNYIMEGIIDGFLRHPDEELQLIAIPFVDADGTVHGDQGKNRAPHDHNRDYADGIYPGVRAVREIMARRSVESVFDLHSPWHLGGRNDKVFIVRNNISKIDDYRLFGQCFAESVTPGSMRYDTVNDIDPGVEWNIYDSQTKQCAVFCDSIPGVLLSFTLETTYFGEPGDVATQEKLVETGRCFWCAYRAFRRKKQIR